MRNFCSPFRLRSVVVLGEMRQSSVSESERNSLSLHVLLSDTGNDLRDVDFGAFRAGHHHRFEVVEF